MKTNLRGIIMISLAAVLFCGMQKVKAKSVVPFTEDGETIAHGTITPPAGYSVMKLVSSDTSIAEVPNDKIEPELTAPVDQAVSFSVVFSQPGSVEITPTFIKVDADGKVTELTQGAVTYVAVSVELTPVARMEDDPLEPEKICLNAQPVYKKAKFKAKVLPNDTSATLTVSTGDDKVTPDKTENIQNGNIIILTGVKPGKYVLLLTHDLCSDSKDDSQKGVVFEFVKTKETYVPLKTVMTIPPPPSTGPPTTTTPAIGIYEDFVMLLDETPFFPVTSSYYYAPLYDAPESKNINKCTASYVEYECLAGNYVNPYITSNAEFSVWLDGKFKVITNPKGAYAGKIEAEVSVKLKGKTYIDPAGGTTNTAGYFYQLKIEKASMDSGNKQGTTKWNEHIKQTLSFSVPATGKIKIESHSCAQTNDKAKKASVTGKHDPAKLKKFKIINSEK